MTLINYQGDKYFGKFSNKDTKAVSIYFVPMDLLLILNRASLHEKCPYLEFFWSVFSHIWPEYG